MADKQINKLPSSLQSTVLKNFFETTVEQLFSKSNIESISAYVGRKESEQFDASSDFYIKEDTPNREKYSLEPVVNSLDLTTGESTNILFYEDFLNQLKSYGSDTSQQNVLFDTNFYAMNSSRNVYKCLDNNNNTASTVEPTGTNASTILSTADGYKWKYMYTLSASEQSNFLSTDFMAVSTNSSVSSNAVDGAIDIVKIKTAGSGGADGTHTGIAIKGDGTGGVVSVVVTSGAVTAVNVTSAGTGYTFGTISNAQIVSAGATNLVGAELDVIIPPKGGHGFNAVQELGAFFVMTNVSLEGTESANSGDVSVANDFRRVCLIRDPQSGGSAASAVTLRATKAVQLTGVSGSFNVDEKITQASTGAVGIVVEWDSTNSLLYYVQTRHNDEGVDANGNQTAFSGTNVITGAGGASGTPVSTSGTVNNVVIASGYSVPEIDHDSGDVLYVENRAPITRAADQTENIKLIIEF